MRCIGTDADNIRPAQRALQLFKNSAVLELLLGKKKSSIAVAAGDSKVCTGDVDDDAGVNAHYTCASVPTATTTTNTVTCPASALDTLAVLLPALHRGGQLSWNPTVNKMTGLAIRNLMVGC